MDKSAKKFLESLSGLVVKSPTTTSHPGFGPLSEGQSQNTNPFRKKPSSDDLAGLIQEFERSQERYGDCMCRYMAAMNEWDKHVIENNVRESIRFKKILLDMAEDSLALRKEMLTDMKRVLDAKARLG